MRMHEVSLFDPFAVVAGPNPPLFDEPFRFSVQDHVGRVLYLDPRRVKPMKRQPRSDAEQAKLCHLVINFGRKPFIAIKDLCRRADHLVRKGPCHVADLFLHLAQVHLGHPFRNYLVTYPPDTPGSRDSSRDFP